MKIFYPRLASIKALVILLVVFVHANVTYSGLGDWFYTEQKFENLDTPHAAVHALFGTSTQAWFMGLLFLVSGFLAHRSLQGSEKGPWFRKRLVRLGIPLLLFMFILSPLTNFFAGFASGSPLGFFDYFLGNLTSGHVVGASGPLWFVLALLLFSIPHAVAFKKNEPLDKKPLRPSLILLIVLGTAILTFGNRLLWSIGFSFINLQFPFFVSYVVLYVIGCQFARSKYNEADLRRYKPLFVITLIVALPIFVVMSAVGGAFEGKGDLFKGGLSLQSAMYSVWESLLAIGISIGAFAIALGKPSNDLNLKQSIFAKHSFGIFVFHAPVLVLTSLAFKSWQTDSILKTVVTAVITIVVTTAFTWLIDKVKFLRIFTR